MGNFDRPRRKITIPEMPERLKRLDQELMRDRVRDFDYLTLTRKGLRLRVCVLRDIDNRCFATATLGRKSFRVGSGCPSGAVRMLMIVLRVRLAELPAPRGNIYSASDKNPMESDSSLHKSD